MLGGAPGAPDCDDVSETPGVRGRGGVPEDHFARAVFARNKGAWPCHVAPWPGGTSPHICNATPSMVCQKIAPQIIIL